MCESCQATHPATRRHIGVSRSSKVFTITADTSNGLVTFGMLGRKVWVMVVRNDGTTLNSLDTPQANRIASYWLPKSLWPLYFKLNNLAIVKIYYISTIKLTHSQLVKLWV